MLAMNLQSLQSVRRTERLNEALGASQSLKEIVHCGIETSCNHLQCDYSDLPLAQLNI
jgi:hypothetical protein